MPAHLTAISNTTKSKYPQVAVKFGRKNNWAQKSAVFAVFIIETFHIAYATSMFIEPGCSYY